MRLKRLRVTHVYPLTGIWNAVALLTSPNEEHIKILLTASKDNQNSPIVVTPVRHHIEEPAAVLNGLEQTKAELEEASG